MSPLSPGFFGDPMLGVLNNPGKPTGNLQEFLAGWSPQCFAVVFDSHQPNKHLLISLIFLFFSGHFSPALYIPFGLFAFTS
jgi:hypothetical protein